MVRDFEKCDDNINRSVLTLYRGGLISETKYNSIRSSLMFKLIFCFELIPSDMKFLATLNSELSNSATFPSTFANVKLDDIDGLGNVMWRKGAISISIHRWRDS